MSRAIHIAIGCIALIAASASRLQAQVSPAFNVSINPSIVTVTQGAMTSFTLNIAVDERRQFQLNLAGLPSGVISQVPVGHPGANTIVLTALSGAATGTFNVELTVLAGNNPQAQTLVLNVKPLPVPQWEYRVERTVTEHELEAVAASLGEQSWELVSVLYRERGNGLQEWVGFFKRQRRLRE